jgi:hypothetical protein
MLAGDLEVEVGEGAPGATVDQQNRLLRMGRAILPDGDGVGVDAEGVVEAWERGRGVLRRGCVGRGDG